MQIKIKRSRVRKPTAPRTCCPTHTDTCKFGRQHGWSMGWIGGPYSINPNSEPGWHDSMHCSDCGGFCMAELEEGQRP